MALSGPKDDFLPVFFPAEAILKNAPHPNAAKLYVAWFLSKEWQSETGVAYRRRILLAQTRLHGWGGRIRNIAFRMMVIEPVPFRRRLKSLKLGP